MKISEKLIVVSVLALFATAVHAQETVEPEIIIPEGYELVDSLVYVQVASADSALVGRDIFDVMPSRLSGDPADVKVRQSESVRAGMLEHISTNPSRNLSGYRVRIFFDNRQTARHESEKALREFTSRYHGVPAYRSYTNPYFKVTVGDFRTRSEAVELMKRILWDFPSAFIVKENIKYPVVDRNNSFKVDTLKVLRKVVDVPVGSK